MSDDVDLTDTIIARADQLNADDLISGPITVQITSVSKVSKDQPIVIGISGGRQPYKPCKTMRRILVDVWGTKGQEYVGKYLTLYRNPDVLFGGEKVGGIEISHMSGLTRPRELTLAVTRGKKKKYVVQPLKDIVSEWTGKLNACTTLDQLLALGAQLSKTQLSDDERKTLLNIYNAKGRDLKKSPKPDATDLNAANETYSSLHQRIVAGPSRTDGAQILEDITAAKNDGAITGSESDELTALLAKEME